MRHKLRLKTDRVKMQLRARAITATQAINNSLPELLQGPYFTTSSALKRYLYVGALQEWPGYNTEVVESCADIADTCTMWQAKIRPQEENSSGVDESNH